MLDSGLFTNNETDKALLKVARDAVSCGYWPWLAVFSTKGAALLGWHVVLLGKQILFSP